MPPKRWWMERSQVLASPRCFPTMPPLPVHVVHLGGEGLLPLKVRAFLDFAAPRLKARLVGDLA